MVWLYICFKYLTFQLPSIHFPLTISLCLNQLPFLSGTHSSGALYWLVSSRETEPIKCVRIYVYVCVSERERERERWFKKLAHVIVVSGKFKICRIGQQAGDIGKNCHSLCPKIVCQNPQIFQRGQSFYLKPSTDWMQPTDIIDPKLTSSKSIPLHQYLDIFDKYLSTMS